MARQTEVELGPSWFGSQQWLVSYLDGDQDGIARLISRSYKVVLTIGQLLIAVCYWPNPGGLPLISRVSHMPLWPTSGSWLTYEYSTARHGEPPTRDTEVIDILVGTRIVHPARQGEFVTVPASRY